jgi:hypothetical protein
MFGKIKQNRTKLVAIEFPEQSKKSMERVRDEKYESYEKQN